MTIVVLSRPCASRRRGAIALVAVLGLGVVAAPAGAHSGHEHLDAFARAALHPWTGLDHVLAACTAGLLAAHRGARGGAAVIAAYLGGLAAGVLFGGAAGGLALETALGVSVVALAWLLARAPSTAGLVMVLTALFAAWHGAAHRFDSAAAGPLSLSIGGFVLSTAVLLALGVGVGHRVLRERLHRRLAAWPIAVAGAMLLAITWTT